MKRVFLVTGAAGFLGNTIVKKLLAQKETVRAFIMPQDQMTYTDSSLSIIKGNVLDRKSLEPLFEGLDHCEVIVIHCAGIVSIASKYQQAVYDVNVTGTKNVMELCLQYKVAKVIYVSSVHAIPEKKQHEVMHEVDHFKSDEVTGLYAKTKAEASNYVLEMAKKGLPVSIVHPSGIMGPGNYNHDHLNQLIVDYMNHKLTAIVKGGYDFVDVRDVADGIIACCNLGRSGECYILSNHYFTIKEIVDLLHKITGKRKIKTVLPLWFAKMTAPLAELYYKCLKQKPLYTAYSLYTLTSNASFSHQKATTELGYQPRAIEETLQDAVHWLIKQGRIKP